MQITAKITGADNVQKGLNTFGRAAKTTTQASIGRAMKRAMKRSVPFDGGSGYSVPLTMAQAQGRGYERTGLLGRETFLTQDGASYRIESNASRNGRAYSRFVIGDASGAGQAGIHAGRWVTMAQAVDDELTPLLEEIEGELDDISRAQGIGL